MSLLEPRQVHNGLSIADQTSSQLSLLSAWWVLVVHSFQRHWRVRQMGWVAIALLAISVVAVLLVSARPAGWGLADRPFRRTQATYRETADQLLLPQRYEAAARLQASGRESVTGTESQKFEALSAAYDTPMPFDPLRDSLQTMMLSIPSVILRSQTFLHNWALMNFSVWVVSTLYIGFVLPLFTLSYASGAIGAERESRSLVWLLTRPMPRSAIYLAKYVGTLPWCLAFGVGGFLALCLAGGPTGRTALALYWPAALGATVVFSALFHLLGAVFNRPVVLGLVYVFFFEALVAALPGSLKLLSLAFYARSLMYNRAAEAGYPVEMMNMSGAMSAQTTWIVLSAATVALTGLGMFLFSRSEHHDDV